MEKLGRIHFKAKSASKVETSMEHYGCSHTKPIKIATNILHLRIPFTEI